ncbi:MAG: sce7726 family protein [Pseudomonadota bacterium]
MLNEGDIKAAVIDKLFSAEALTDAVLINEMVVANWSRRADLVVANGKLHAFEIKSDLDSLRRLDGQLETYLHRFDKVTVVSTPKFISLIKDSADPRVEIWCATEEEHGVGITVARRGVSSNVTNKRILCAYLLKVELVSLLGKQGKVVSVDMPRNELELLAEVLSIKCLRSFVLDALKRRYRDTFELFCKIRNESTKPTDLANLSKLKARFDIPLEPIRVCADESSLNAAWLDLDKIAQKFGPLPADMPSFVRRRA